MNHFSLIIHINKACCLMEHLTTKLNFSRNNNRNIKKCHLWILTEIQALGSILHTPRGLIHIVRKLNSKRQGVQEHVMQSEIAKSCSQCRTGTSWWRRRQEVVLRHRQERKWQQCSFLSRRVYNCAGAQDPLSSPGLDKFLGIGSLHRGPREPSVTQTQETKLYVHSVYLWRKWKEGVLLILLSYC